MVITVIARFINLHNATCAFSQKHLSWKHMWVDKHMCWEHCKSFLCSISIYTHRQPLVHGLLSITIISQIDNETRRTVTIFKVKPELLRCPYLRSPEAISLLPGCLLGMTSCCQLHWNQTCPSQFCPKLNFSFFKEKFSFRDPPGFFSFLPCMYLQNLNICGLEFFFPQEAL